MNPQTFFDHFERLTDAPNAVARLRELILQLAVQGKLVAQDERDEPASTLLEKIKAEKARLVKEKKISMNESSPLIEEDAEPFRLPTGWQWVHLSQITNTVHYGYTASANHILKDVRLLRITDIQNGKVDWDSVPGCEIDKDKVKGVELRDGDLLIARTGGTIGKSFLVENVSVRAVFASYLIRAVPNKFLFPKYLKLFLESELYWRQLYAKSMGTGQPNVNATSLKSLLVPLPPVEEQKRIVAKVDELMRLCDELERKQAARREARSSLNRAMLDQLLAASDATEFQARWRTARDQFTTLTATPDLIGKLRQTILQLAVQGKLTHQDPQDEPANSLLSRIRAERERLVEEKKIGSSNLIEYYELDKPKIDLPKGWTWSRFGEVTYCYRGHNPPKHEFVTEPRVGYVRFIQITDFKTDDSAVYVPISKGLKYVYKGEIAMAAYRHIGKLSRAVEGAFNVAICKVMEVLPMDRDYIEMLIGSVFIKDELLKEAGRAHIPSMHTEHLLSLFIPIPPLEEQKRIIAAANQLLALCDELEAGLRQLQEDGERLLRAVVRSLLASASGISAAEADALVVQ